MKLKKMLTMLLVICMVLSCLTPAGAVVAANNTKLAAETSTVTPADKDKTETPVVGLNVKDDPSYLLSSSEKTNGTTKGTVTTGHWSAEATEGSSIIGQVTTNLPSSVQDLEEYGKTGKATVIVVLKDKPLIEYYSSILDVPADEIQALEQQQSYVIAAIQEDVLDGAAPEVVGQFNYLTNAIAIDIDVAKLPELAAIEGVESVFVSPIFYACETTMNPATVSSGQMSGVDTVWNTEGLGYTGAGMTVAILDTGIDYDHPSFAAFKSGSVAAENAKYDQADIAALLENTYASLMYSQTTGKALTADKVYSSNKIPFAFDYAAVSTDASHDRQNGDHGSHVAGISAANAVEGTGVVGMAPDAQLIVMKVFSPEGGAGMVAILSALEDCMRLGVDVANLSLGSPAGFSKTGEAWVDDIFASIATTDLIVDIAAGNEGTSAYGSLWGNYLNTTENPDTATISSPATYNNALSVGSVDNVYTVGNYFTVGETKVFYQDTYDYLAGITNITLADLVGKELEYVIVPGLGDWSDYEGIDVEGKVAVVHRGTLTFLEKVENAIAAGACAVLIWNNNPSEDIFGFYMKLSDDNNEGYPVVPVALISTADGEAMEVAAEKTMTVSPSQGMRLDSHGGQMSTFSSWGVSPDLSLTPDISGVGGNIYSCYDGGGYGLMSGTSMATPQVAGVTALVLQYIESNFPGLTIAEKRVLVDALMMSTAVPVVDNRTGVEASPRQQGSGLVNAAGAVTSEAYITVDGGRPKGELGDSANGVYEFTFTVHNFGDTDKIYAVNSSLLTEAYTEYKGEKFMAEYDYALSKEAVSIDSDSPHYIDDDTTFISGITEGAVSGDPNQPYDVTEDATCIVVKPGETAEVTVTITLTAEDKAFIDGNFPNGNYVEGFVYLRSLDEGGVNLSLPFLGFYGDWAKAPVFDTGFWYENGFWEDVAGMENVNLSKVDGNLYFTVPWLSLGATDWVLGFNPYTGGQVDKNGDVIYNSANNIVSPNGDGMADAITNYYISLMRNARSVFLTYTDEAGNIVDEEELEYLPKTMFTTSRGMTVPLVYSWYFTGLYDFTDEEGNPLPDGTKLTLTLTGVIDGEFEDGTPAEEHKDYIQENSSIVIPIIVDTSAPEIVEIAEIVDQGGKKYLDITVTDASLAYAVLMNTAGTQYYAELSDLDFVNNGDGTYNVTIEVTDLGSEFTLILCDYGCNEAPYALTWSKDPNIPVMDTSKLYGYKVYDWDVGYTEGYDWMFGWNSIDKETAAAEMLQHDAYEYYAITAAVYVDGYIFATDAGGNFLYMTPGLWNRTFINNIGLNVVDMAFDDVNGILYAIASDSDMGYTYLVTIDLLTGEWEELCGYDMNYGLAPWAMTFVGDELYCCAYNYDGFYQIDIEGETFEMIQVEDADGNIFYPTNEAGSEVYPTYAQSMTYSKADGKIYWVYYGGWGSELITIDPTAWTFTAVAMAGDCEYVGVLTLEETDYKIPASDTVTGIALSTETLILSVGKSEQLSAAPLPWNIENAEITWYSEDDTVAVISEDGTVTAVGPGETWVVAACGDAEAYCYVYVADIKGTLHAFDYYSEDDLGFGYWLDLDMLSMTETPIAMSPVEFLAADYNGHNGLVYGFDEFGRCYSYNPATGECIALGASSGLLVADMAYDYSTGYMYAIVYDANNWTTTLYYVNMTSGKLVEAGVLYDLLLTLACDAYGTLYALNYDGILNMVYWGPMYGGGGGGIMPWNEDDGEYGDDYWGDDYYEEEEEVEYGFISEPLMASPLSRLQYNQSMCYDHNNDAIIWANPETGKIFWFDVNAATFIDLGDPNGSGVMQYMGLYVVPEEGMVPELEEIPVESVEVEDMLMLLGGEGAEPVVSINPLNANLPYEVTYTIADESVVSYEDGIFVANKVGSTTVTVTVTCGDITVEDECTVTVKSGTDSLFGYLYMDLANYGGNVWIEIPDSNPAEYGYLTEVYYNGAYLTIYSAEYVDGYVYAYGLDYDAWPSTWLFLKIDPTTWEIVDVIEMDATFPFVYDMAFDYTTGMMMGLAGPSDASSDLYYINMETGELIEAATFGGALFLSLAVDADGTVYVMETGADDMDATMYTVDMTNGTLEFFMDTGVYSDMLSSMTYDYDTGYIYWASFNNYNYGALHLIDLDERVAYELGTVGESSSMVTGLMSICDSYPEIPDELIKLIMTTGMHEIAVGDVIELDVFKGPAGADVELVWTSSDESVAAVDENGVVTAVSAGTAVIIVTDKATGLASGCVVVVRGDADYFITYNWTDGGFSVIGRPDYSAVTNKTEAEDEPAVRAMEIVNGIIYAYDVNGDLFITGESVDFERIYIGNCGIEVDEPEEFNYGYYIESYEYLFDVRDLAWDAANNRMLAIGCHAAYQETTYPDYGMSAIDFVEMVGGCRLYEVDLKTGELTELCIIGGEYSAESNIYTITVTDDGQAYIYSTYADWISKLDTETGLLSNVSTLQNQSIYGAYEGQPMSMAYDASTDMIYMLFTGGETYRMITFNVSNGALHDAGYIGDASAAFAGLVIAEEHTCDIEHKDPTCTEKGYHKTDCVLCGPSAEIPALGHDYISQGSGLFVCATCGDSYTISAPSTPVTPPAADDEDDDDKTTTTEKVENEDGSVTETTTTVETVTNKDGSVTETNTKTEVTETKDGSTVTSEVVTETVTNKDGTVETVTTETVTTEMANGTTATTVTDSEGIVTSQVTISKEAVAEAAKSGETVVIPVPEVSATTSEAAATVTVSVPKTETAVKVEIPVAEVTETSVVVIVHADGTEEIVQKTALTEAGLAIDVSGEVTVKVIDNTKEFVDVDPEGWSSKAIDFASSREILNGMGNEVFSPKTNMTRGQLAVMLYNLESKPEVVLNSTFTDSNDTWYTEAVEWAAAEKIILGNTDGTFGGENDMTREQMVAFLYRYAGSPKVTGSAKFSSFNDCASVSDWAVDAMSWAIEMGIINGMGDNTINPNGTATREQVAQILMNFLNAQ